MNTRFAFGCMLLALMGCESEGETELEAEVKALAKQVQDLQEGLSACMDLTEQGENTVSLIEILTEHANKIADNKEAIGKVDQRLGEEVARLDGRVTNLDRQVQQNTSDIDTLKNNVDGNQRSLEDLNELTIQADVVWAVGSSSSADYSNLAKALEAARNVSIHPKGSLRIEVEDGVYSHTETLFLNHPDGERMSIVGNTTSPESVVLSFSGSLTESVSVNQGHFLNAFKGFTVRGDAQNTWNGLNIQWQAVALMGSLIVEDFANHGILVGNQAGLFLDGHSVTVQDNGGLGLESYYGGYINGAGVVAENNGSNGLLATQGGLAVVPDGRFAQNGGSGIASHYNSLVVSHGADARENDSYGFYAYGQGYIYAPSYEDSSSVFHQTTSSQNGEDGFYAYDASIRASESKANNNSRYGYRVNYSGYVDARETAGNGGSAGVSYEYSGSEDRNATLRE